MTKIKPHPDKWLRIVKEMLDDDDFSFAEEYLESVKEYIEEHDKVTTKQTTAILNIRRSRK